MGEKKHGNEALLQMHFELAHGGENSKFNYS